MRASIYKSPEGEAEILALYDEALARLGVEYESRTVGTRFGDTHVLVTGPEKAPPVIVLPGGNFLNPTCLGWFLPLAEGYRLYAPDIVGQPGLSAQTRPSSRGNGHARWVEDVLDGLGLQCAPFVGLSYGAGIALRTAGHAPKRVSGAALVSPAGLASGPILRMMREVVVPMLLYRLSLSRERLLRAARPLLTEMDGDIARQIGAVYRHVRLDTSLPRRATRDELAMFQAPALVFAAEDDVFFPGEAVLARAREVIPNLQVAVCLKRSRHIPSQAEFERISERIQGFLRDLDSS